MNLLFIISLSFFSANILPVHAVSDSFVAEKEQSRKAKPSWTISQKSKTDSDFPNFLGFLEESEALKLINQSVAHILKNLDLQYVQDVKGKPQIHNEGFFQTLDTLVKSHDKKSKTYVNGGVVRSILGYLYAELFKSFGPALQKCPDNENFKKDKFTRDVFERILSQKKFNRLDVLGVGSDLDILVQFSGTTQDRSNVLKNVTSFLNSVRDFKGIKKEKASVLIDMLYPEGDVEDYDTRMISDTPYNTVLQGGSSLDWLCFPISQDSGTGMIQPKEYPHILNKFIQGRFDYYPSPKGKGNLSKQIVRGLRPLAEIPFLKLTEAGEKTLKNEFQIAFRDPFFIDLAVEIQFKKLIRNSRFEGAHGRFSALSPPKEENSIEALVINFGKINARARVPLFAQRHDLDLRKGRDKGGLKQRKLLCDLEEFFEKCTDNGFVYHGTKSVDDLFNMVRNGFYISCEGQGNAMYGPGVYTTKDRSIAEGYAKEAAGWVFKLPVKRHQDLRVVYWSTFLARVSDLNLFDKKPETHAEIMGFCRQYDIDIIIDGSKGYPILQNIDAVTLPQNVRGVASIEKEWAENYIQDALSPKNQKDLSLSSAEMLRSFNILHPLGNLNPLFGEEKQDLKNFYRVAKTYIEHLCDESIQFLKILYHNGAVAWTRHDKDFYKTLKAKFKQYLSHRLQEELSDEIVNLYERLENITGWIQNSDNTFVLSILRDAQNPSQVLSDLEVRKKDGKDVDLEYAKKALIQDSKYYESSFPFLKEICKESAVFTDPEILSVINRLKDKDAVSKCIKDMLIDPSEDGLVEVLKVLDDPELRKMGQDLLEFLSMETLCLTYDLLDSPSAKGLELGLKKNGSALLRGLEDIKNVGIELCQDSLQYICEVNFKLLTKDELIKTVDFYKAHSGRKGVYLSDIGSFLTISSHLKNRDFVFQFAKKLGCENLLIKHPDIALAIETLEAQGVTPEVCKAALPKIDQNSDPTEIIKSLNKLKGKV